MAVGWLAGCLGLRRQLPPRIESVRPVAVFDNRERLAAEVAQGDEEHPHLGFHLRQGWELHRHLPD